MIIKYKVLDAVKPHKENGKENYACLKYTPHKELLEIGSVKSNHVFVRTIKDLVNIKKADTPPKFYEYITIRYQLKEITMDEFSSIIEDLEKRTDITIQQIEKLSRLM